MYVLVANLVTLAALSIVGFFAVRSHRHLRRFAALNSERIAALQRQIDLCLITQVRSSSQSMLPPSLPCLQTLTGVVLGVLPTGTIVFLGLFRHSALVDGLLLPSAWLPFVNALSTLCVVGAYRRSVGRLLRRSAGRVDDSDEHPT